MGADEHIQEYDTLRVLLTCLVVFGHGTYLSWSTINGAMNNDFAALYLVGRALSLWELIDDFFNWIYSFHMPMFFMLSGAVFCVQREKYQDFYELIKKKVKRLMVPYFLVGSFFMIPLKGVTGFYDFSLSKWIMTYLSYFSLNLSESGQLWFLASLFCTTLVFYPFSKLYTHFERNDKKINKFGIVLACAVLTLIYKNSVDLGVFSRFSSNFRVDQYFQYFSFGYFFHLQRKKLNDFLKNRRATNLLMFFSLFVSMVNSGGVNSQLGSMIFPVVFIYVLAYKLTYTFHIHRRKLYLFFSKNMFNVYLYHDPLNFLINHISSVFFGFKFFAQVFGVLFYYICRTFLNSMLSIGIGKVYDCIIYKNMEKINCLKNELFTLMLIVILVCCLVFYRLFLI